MSDYREDDFEKWSAEWMNSQPSRTHVAAEDWACAAWLAAWEASRDDTMQQIAWEEDERVGLELTQ